jgi:Pro-kumamolisin, activation domain
LGRETSETGRLLGLVITFGLTLLTLAVALRANAQMIGTALPQVPALITQALDEGSLTTLVDNTRPEANEENDRGLVRDDLPLEHMLPQLRRSPQQEKSLDRFIDRLQDAGSANYQQWITAKEFGQRFGLAQQDVDKVTAWLQSHGFEVSVYPNRMVIDFSGTAGQVRAAFHTEIHQLVVNGQQHIANMSDPQIPSALTPAVTGVVSLHDFKPHAMNKPRANYTFTNSNGTFLAVVPADLATIYHLTPVFNEITAILAVGCVKICRALE